MQYIIDVFNLEQFIKYFVDYFKLKVEGKITELFISQSVKRIQY